MSIAEIRGYAAAYAIRFVEGEADRTPCLQERNSTLRNHVIDAAVKKLVVMVIHDALNTAYPIPTQMMAA
jgi:hypothetical protein